MGKINRELLHSFADCLGPKGYTEDQDTIAPWLKDWRGLYEGKALAMLSPASTEEMAMAVRLAATHRISLVPQGGNTSMVGGATPSPDGTSLILSTRRLNRVRSLNRSSGSIIVEAGVILSSLHDAAKAQGLRFPLSLGAKGSATVGGLCSTNAGGTEVLRFGTMRKLVLGLEAVLPDGRIFDELADLKKDARGYDLSQLLIGAEGTLGIITAASLRLVPLPSDRAAAWLGLASPQQALDLLRFLEKRSGQAVESFELMAAGSIDLVLRHIPGTRAPLARSAPWQILVDYATMDGLTATEELSSHAAAALEAGLAEDAVLATSNAQAESFWRIRESISEAERAEGPTIAHDISVPVDAMPRFMSEATAAVEAQFPNIITSAFGHLGDGNVHFHLRPAPTANREHWKDDIGKAPTQLIYDLVTQAGGSISAEHGIGQMKRTELGRLSSPARISALRAIKAAFDPLDIMNPGKLVPLASETPSA